jgi:DNA processing protein
VAIVGSRDADPEAAAFAAALAARVAAPVVSGLALGIDAAAHEGALAAGTCGPWRMWATASARPIRPSTRRLEERIVAAGGAVASERLPGEAVAGWALIKRDRLQAAHAAALVLVQSRRTAARCTRCSSPANSGVRASRCAPRAGEAYAGNARALAEGARELPWDPDEAASLLR